MYASREAGIESFAETYSFNIESVLFNHLTLEQQKLWRKEIENAVINGGKMGLELADDKRYDKELSKDLKEAIDEYAPDFSNSIASKAAVDAVRDVFKAGAKWQKQQMKEALQTEYEKGRFDMKEEMMKDAVRGTVDYPIIGHDFPNIYPNYRDLKDYCDKHRIEDNDNVKLIMVKED